VRQLKQLNNKTYERFDVNSNNLKNLADKAVIVTGGGSGIGQSICERLASNGAKTFVLDLDESTAQRTVANIVDAGGQAMAYEVDVTDSGQVGDVVREINQTTTIDILVNNAGIAHIGSLETTSGDDLDRLYQVNIKGVYNLARAVVPTMKANKSGNIINMASIASSIGLSDRFAYSMTKGAVKAMTYSIARDYIDYGIRCNCISPARVHTPFVDNFLDENYPDNRDEMFTKLSQSQPIGRMGTADEIAGLVAYLSSDEAAFITGSDLPIDGGFITLNT